MPAAEQPTSYNGKLVPEENTEAFPILSAADLAVVESYGARRAMQTGEYLFRQGDQTTDFYVLLSGAIDILVQSDGQERLIVRYGPGRFVGELNLVTGL